MEPLPVWAAIMVLVFSGASFFFALAETALFSLGNTRARQLTEQNGGWAIGLLNELYEKRGDTYLRLSDYRQGVLDFRRIFEGIPNFADSTDRWRELGKTADQENYFSGRKERKIS